jgi:hypothetical protein
MDYTDEDSQPYYNNNNLNERSQHSVRNSGAFNMRRESDSRRISKQRPFSSPLNRNEPQNSMSDLVIDSSKKKLSVSRSAKLETRNTEDYYRNPINPDVAVDLVITEVNSIVKLNQPSMTSSLARPRPKTSTTKATKRYLPVICTDVETKASIVRAVSDMEQRLPMDLDQAYNSHYNPSSQTPTTNDKKSKKKKKMSTTTPMSEIDRNTLALGKLVLNTVLINPDLKTTESLSKHFFEAWLAKNNLEYNSDEHSYTQNSHHTDPREQRQAEENKARVDRAHKDMLRLKSSAGPVSSETGDTSAIKQSPRSSFQPVDAVTSIHQSVGETAPQLSAMESQQHFTRLMSAMAMEALDVLVDTLGRDYPVCAEIRSALCPLLFVDEVVHLPVSAPVPTVPVSILPSADQVSAVAAMDPVGASITDSTNNSVVLSISSNNQTSGFNPNASASRRGSQQSFLRQTSNNSYNNMSFLSHSHQQQVVANQVINTRLPSLKNLRSASSLEEGSVTTGDPPPLRDETTHNTNLNTKQADTPHPALFKSYTTNTQMSIDGLTSNNQSQSHLLPPFNVAGAVSEAQLRFNDSITQHSPATAQSRTGSLVSLTHFSQGIPTSNGGSVYLDSRGSQVQCFLNSWLIFMIIWLYFADSGAFFLAVG